ncbi:ubiquitin-activating enzyme E3, putative [Bodo saltans]|uniref:Ubiquitin-like 1-activating enzyme E1A n=1 Tax=Bodo saltans TaxID=75058 RepID=A0A0S4JDE8_BODSA|nr:ubiquitin-activating enzyme E3, putative [Bodo saltans]|eukprot:CUG89594.1 ubiquitin-activating enzyme E3, putative [Bodo saltans]
MRKRIRSPQSTHHQPDHQLVIVTAVGLPFDEEVTTTSQQQQQEEHVVPRKAQRTEMSQSASNSYSTTNVDSGAAVEQDNAFLDRYSRQIGTYGLDTMTKLVSLKVLIVGCGGVGAEAAKNLALAGVHTISILDNRTPRPADLGVNFAIPEQAVGGGSSIAQLTCQLLHELNPMVRVHVIGELTENVVKSHSVVVFTSAAPDLRLSTLTRWDHFCRAQATPISFLLALQCGAVGSVFVDHGPSFFVKDLDGRAALQKQILEVVNRVDKRGVEYTRVRFSTPEGQTPGALRDYTNVKFTDVKGLVTANGVSINDKSFDGVCCTGDAKNCVRIYPSLKSLGYSDYVTGGFIHEQKETVEVKFRSLEEVLVAPGAFINVSPMMDNVLESLVHVTVNGLLRFAEANGGALPAIHDKAAADAVISHAKAFMSENEKAFASSPKYAPAESAPTDPNEERPSKYPPPPPPLPIVVDSIDESFVRTASLLAAAELQPLGAFFGAVVAQEVVKMTGKFSPIHQFFHFHCAEVLPENVDYTANAAEFGVDGSSRYDNIVAIFGKTFAAKLQNLKLFMVGCGALGCENIKNFALSGICCGPNGSLVVTDNDRIEISNLSRQFLFREDNVGQPKSVAACNRMRSMNSFSKVDARQDFVSPNTQHLYPDAFWMQLDAVVNALDNIEARLYVDYQCVLFHKVLVEAGTMGTGGNVDIVVPRKTTSYSDGGAADETGGIPMCTLRNFPYIYDHCIEWARAQFDDLFVSPVQQSLQLIEDPASFVAKVRREIDGAETEGQRRTFLEKHVKSLKGIQATLTLISSQVTIADCVAMAWRVFHANFRDRILDLQLAFPADAKKSNGDAFWSGHRTFPTAVDGSAIGAATPATNDVLEFLITAANDYATMFGVHPPKHAPKFNQPNNRWQQQYRNHDWITSEVKKLAVPEFKRSAVDGLDDEAAGALGGDQASADGALRKELDDLLTAVEATGAACKGSKAEPLDFEKDDDDNFHIDFITAASNLRAINYAITPQDRLKVKMVAGKIIPAIATTTAAVTGLALIEFFKVLQGKDVSTLRNGMIDVGTNNYVLFDRDPPIKKRTAVEKTYLPEKDYTWRKKIIRVPANFTKYDRFEVEVTATTTVREFADKLLEQVNKTLPEDAPNQYDVDGLGVGLGSLWNGSAKHSNANRPLLDVIEQQKRSEGFPSDRSFWETRVLFPDLQVTLSIDDEDDVDDVEVEPATIVLRIKKD